MCLKIIFVKLVLDKSFENIYGLAGWGWLFEIFAQTDDFFLRKNRIKIQTLISTLFLLKQRIFGQAKI